MLYAPLSSSARHQVPTDWSRVEGMFRYLNRMVDGYQLEMERKVFYDIESEEYRATLVRWEHRHTPDHRRVSLVSTSDPKHMESVLLVLIREAEQGS